MKHGWEIKKLGEVCNFKSGTTISPSLEREVGDILYVKVGDMNLPENEIEINTSSRFVNSNEIKLAQIIPEGAVIFPKRGGAIATNKKRKVIQPTIVDLNTMAIIPTNKLNSEYFYYWFQMIDLHEISNGTTIPQINNYSFDEIFIQYPKSLPEQQYIVFILDEAFTAIAKAKANAEQNLKNAKELFESYLQGVFEKGCWETKTIQVITKVVNGYAFASKDFKPTNTIKSVKITNVGVKEFVEETANYLPEKFKETLKDFQVREGNIVIALTRTIISAGLKVAVVPASYDGALVNQRVAALAPNEMLVNKSFLYYYLSTRIVSKYVLDHVNTLMQPNLSINDLKNMPVPCPLISEQLAIVRQLDALRAETNRLEAIYQQKLLNLEELKKTILQKAFAGELKTEKEVAVR